MQSGTFSAMLYCMLASFPGSTPQLFSEKLGSGAWDLHGARKAGKWSLGTRLLYATVEHYIPYRFTQ